MEAVQTAFFGGSFPKKIIKNSESYIFIFLNGKLVKISFIQGEGHDD